jgi:transposase
MLLTLKGVGAEVAAVLWTEALRRHFDNRQQISAYAGLTPTPWMSRTLTTNKLPLARPTKVG